MPRKKKKKKRTTNRGLMKTLSSWTSVGQSTCSIVCARVCVYLYSRLWLWKIFHQRENGIKESPVQSNLVLYLQGVHPAQNVLWQIIIRTVRRCSDKQHIPLWVIFISQWLISLRGYRFNSISRHLVFKRPPIPTPVRFWRFHTLSIVYSFFLISCLIWFF